MMTEERKIKGSNEVDPRATGPRRPSTTATPGRPPSAAGFLRATGRPSAAVSASAGSPSPGAAAVREDKEPRPARRQLSRFLLCVTGSWKRSCGSSCSLAGERLQRRERAKHLNAVTVQVPRLHFLFFKEKCSNISVLLI